jgi:nucleoside-diphosphate-sugar epimerase
MAEILVTGGAGMIGSNLVRRLVRGGHRVRVIDNLWRGRRENLLDDRGTPLIDLDRDLHLADLSEAGTCDSFFEGADYIFHLADVVAGVDFVFRNQGSIFRQNLLINSNAVTAARRFRPRGFIYVGTACSFPKEKQTGVEAPPLREEDQYPASPESSYGWSKLMGEYEALLMGHEEGIPVAILTLHNVYGTPCDYGERAQVLPALVRKAIRYPDDPFVVWGSGAQGRAFVHVDDVVDALVAAMEKGWDQGVIQIGPNVCTSIREAAETVVAVSGKSIEIQYDTTKPEGDRGRCADYAKASRVLGWSPRTSLRDGVEGLYRWMESRVA